MLVTGEPGIRVKHLKMNHLETQVVGLSCRSKRRSASVTQNVIGRLLNIQVRQGSRA